MDHYFTILAALSTARNFYIRQWVESGAAARVHWAGAIQDLNDADMELNVKFGKVGGNR